ncbi:sugar ABC transporter ATP-binding protein [Candidatus Aerophobetes bacterium]|uniref:Sugar ABC transporter ATP-binding protein n=1 Tax=Aerophobetes bacterium TaxID=2030807 RepID=A0A662D4Q4_UNCAE|nr:MAG: sugar ABC transporter ATP-binding protein [Candidatus Aerophobetes bacterium]
MKITLEDLCKYFGEVKAVDDLNLEIKDREFVALLGPSGCGKTTTLLMIAGIYKPTSGNILFDGQVVNHLLPKERNIGMVFQSYALYPHMSVFDNITYPLKLKRIHKREMRERAQKVADMMGIGELLDRKPGQLSGGQQQRVAVARALIKEPAILLFDEPLSNLDARLRLRMRGEIKRLQEDLGVTSIYVTHDQVEAMTMASRIAVMNHGVLQAYGTPDQLYNHPDNLFVAGFIGSPPMNFLKMTFEEKESGFYLSSQGLSVRIPDKKGALAKQNNAPRGIIMGIRPEDVSIAPEGDLKAEIYVVEPLGRESLVTFRFDDEEIRALVPASFEGKIGDVMSLKLEKQKIHLFDPETEASLLRNE